MEAFLRRASVVESFLRSFNVHSYQCSGNMQCYSFSEGKPEKVHLQWKLFVDWAGLNVEDLLFDLSYNANWGELRFLYEMC